MVTWVVNGGMGNVGRCKASPRKGVLPKYSISEKRNQMAGGLEII